MNFHDSPTWDFHLYLRGGEIYLSLVFILILLNNGCFLTPTHAGEKIKGLRNAGQSLLAVNYVLSADKYQI